MNYDVFDKIYQDIEKRVKSLNLGIEIDAELKSESYPIVIVENINDDTVSRTTCSREGIDMLGIEVNIYCGEIVIEDVYYSGRSIAYIIAEAVDSVCCTKYSMSRKMTPTPNVDDSIFRITIRYTRNIFNR